jgi:gliding motility-associated-like protein
MRRKSVLNRSLIACIFIQIFGIPIYSQTDPVCSLISDNYSGQVTNSRCAPVTLTMEVVYKFIVPVNSSKLQILYRWNDGTGAETQVAPISFGDTVFRAVESHVYPPAGKCSYTAEAFVICDGVICTSSSRQIQEFSSWAKDNENGGVIKTDPSEALFCEGSDVYVKFRDNSNFNCNINVEPDKPNRLTRWVQFIYGTNTNPGNRIPNITVVDDSWVVHQMTDAAGNSLGTFVGPIIPVPINADAPNQEAYPIYAPAGAVAGDIFEITMRNWNICNPYDNKPFDGIPPVDVINGDNPPITTTALVRIITTPPKINNPKEDFCAKSPILLTVPQVGDTIRWYNDSSRTTLLHKGASFDPTQPPVNLNNAAAGLSRFWVTDAIGQCESTPSKFDMEIYPLPDPFPNAGTDQTICDDRTTLDGSIQNVGTGKWSTKGVSIIGAITNPKTNVSNLSFGQNEFIWTVTSGPCVASDTVIVNSDRQPAPANAGIDRPLCDSTSTHLNALPPTQGGIGHWTKLSAGVSLADSTNPQTLVQNLVLGNNQLIWNIRSKYGTCLSSLDTVNYRIDLSSAPANAGPDSRLCDTSFVQLNGTNPTNNASGSWSVLSGTAMIADVSKAKTSASNLSEGNNAFAWTIHSSLGICPVSSDTVSIIRDLAPNPSYAGPDQSFCNVISSNALNASIPNRGIATWKVITNPSSVPPVFTPGITSPGAIVSINPGNEGKYDLAWIISNGACISSDTLSIDFGVPPPPANAGPPIDTCGLDAVLHAYTPIKGWGTWRQISGKGLLQFPSTRHDPNAHIHIEQGEEDTYKIEWTIASGSCMIGNSNIDTVSVTFRPKPIPPVMKDTSHCGPAAFTLTSVLNNNATVNRWYNAQSAGLLLQEGNNFATPTLSFNQTYYISGYNAVSLCESERVPVNINIHPVPAIPIASNIQRCGAGTLTLTSLPALNASNNLWYSDSTSSIALSKTLNYITPVLPATTSFYVSGSDSISGCESPRKKVLASVYPVPGLPGPNNAAHCGPASIILKASKGTGSNALRWYDDSSVPGILLTTGDSLYTEVIDTTRSYWVASYDTSTGCESQHLETKAIINPIPGLPSATNLSSCGPDTLHFLSTLGANATTNIWYDDILGRNVLSIEKDFTINLLSSKTFWVSSYNQNSGCESPRVKVEGTINPVPNTGTIQGLEVVALNQNNVVYSVFPHAGSTFHWSVPSDVDSVLQLDNIIILAFPSLGNKTLSVYETNEFGCDGPLRTKEILVKQEVLSVKVNIQDSALCINGPIGMLAGISGGTPPFDIQWSGDVTYLSATNIANPVFNSPITGTYHLKVTVNDATSGSSEDSIEIIIHELPVTKLPVKDTTLCAGDTLQINPINTGGSGYYVYHHWTGNTNYLNRTDIQNPQFHSTDNGTFHLHYKVIDTDNCEAQDSMALHIQAPVSKFSSDASVTCSPIQFNFLNQSSGATNYLWNFGDGSSSSNKDVSHVFVNQGNEISNSKVDLIAFDSLGCKNIFSQYVQLYPNPKLTVSVDPQNICSPTNVLLSAAPGSKSYDWDFGDGESQTSDYTVFHIYSKKSINDTVLRVRLVSTTSFGCKDTSYSQLFIYGTPTAMFTAVPDSQMFPDATVSLNNLSAVGNYSYLWYFSDQSTSTLQNPPPHKYAKPGIYFIKLKVTGVHCSDSAEKRIKIIPHPPLADFDDVNPGCAPLTINFQNKSVYADSYMWDFGDGDYSNLSDPSHTYNNGGNYTVKLTVTGPGGSDIKSLALEVYIKPHAFFDYSPKTVDTNDQPIQFTNLSDNGNSYHWNFGDGGSSEDTNPTHKYTSEGMYKVTLLVTAEHSCTDTFVKENAISVTAHGKISFPTVFSPNAQLDENKIFLPAIADNIAIYHLMIFNRWGVLVFESFNADAGWDGFYKNKPAKSDVYMWKVVGKYSNGRSFVFSGDVTLLY